MQGLVIDNYVGGERELIGVTTNLHRENKPLILPWWCRAPDMINMGAGVHSSSSVIAWNTKRVNWMGINEGGEYLQIMTQDN